MEIGYVVVEFNQASGQPELAGLYPYLMEKEEAESDIKDRREATAKAGRHERFAVGTVTVEEED